MSSQLKKRLTPEEYLALERRADYKNEYFDGAIFAMTGASRRHNLIATNLVRELSQQLRSHPCEVYSGDMRVWIPTARVYTYPDVAVACEAPRFADEEFDTLLNPTLLVEVLSRSTASYDRTLKYGYYRAIESLVEYLLVAQDEYRLEHYVKQPDGRWLLADISGLESTLKLNGLPATLKLSEIYDKIPLP